MTADTNKLTDLLQRWDAEHKALYKDIRAQRDDKKLEEQSSDHHATQGKKQRYMEAKRKEEEDERKIEYTKTLKQAIQLTTHTSALLFTFMICLLAKQCELELLV